MKAKSLVLYLTLLFFLSCSTPKNIAYMQEAETLPQNVLSQAQATANPVAMPGDLLDILVGGTNLDAVKPFNRLDMLNQIAGNTYNSYAQSGNTPSYYLIDSEGDIDFPVLGKLHIGGMNKTQITELITSKLYPKYLTEKPTVDIRFKNYKISVIGEVQHPGVFTSPNEQMTIFEAIAMAGDLSITGMRENVMLIRTNADGSRTVQRLNLNDKNIILSPYYNLQQNDVVYVQPNASKSRQSWQIPPALSVGLSSFSILISLATLIISIAK